MISGGKKQSGLMGRILIARKVMAANKLTIEGDKRRRLDACCCEQRAGKPPLVL